MTQTKTPIEIQKDGALPIRCFTSEKLLPDEAARKQLNTMASIDGLKQHISVLPDVHYKDRNPSPTGTVIASNNVLFPRAIDGGINCGIRMMATQLPASDFSIELLDKLFGRLIENIPVKDHATPLLSQEECENVLTHGVSKLIEPLGLPDDELTRVENGGRMLPHLSPDEIREGLTAKALSKVVRKCNKTLGTIGAGNHFLELQEIVEVIDQQSAEHLGLKKGNIVFMLHTDCRRLGKKILQPIIDEAREVYQNGDGVGELWQVPSDSEIGKRYLCGAAAASHAGFANRAAVTHILRKTLREVFDDPSFELSLLYDCGHETVQLEEQNGDKVWVHRHGASHALPASAFAQDSVLGKIGQPIPLPGSMGTYSYIAVACSGVFKTMDSVAHGAGRVMEKDEAKVAYDPKQVESDLKKQGIRLYRYGVDNIAGQTPASFKDPQQVVEVLTTFDLIRPVVKLRPVAVLKG